MIDFKRTGESKDSLGVGLKNILHQGILDFMAKHQSTMECTIGISKIEITKHNSILIYFDTLYTNATGEQAKPFDYFLSLFNQVGLTKYLSRNSYYYQAHMDTSKQPHSTYEYIPKDEYKKYLTEGMVYNNE